MRIGRIAPALRLVAAACAIAAGAACGGVGGGVSGLLFRQYEYEEEMYLSVDGTATVYVNSSVPALNALRGTAFNPGLDREGDLEAVRAYFTSPATRVRPVRTSRRNGRRFVHLRIDVDHVERLREAAPFAWSSYRLTHQGELLMYAQAVGEPAPRHEPQLPQKEPWRGDEIVAFRIHAPSRVEYHNAGEANHRRGNILVWEQSLADRLRGLPLLIDARMQRESILYRTLLLFGGTLAAAGALFAGTIWWVRRRGLAHASETS
jgi:hypothetical protein